MSFNYSQPFMSWAANGLNTMQNTGIGGWVELGRTTAGGSVSSLSVSSLPNKRYYMVLGFGTNYSASQGINIRFNSDTGSNYANRISDNGGADATETSTTVNRMCNLGGTTDKFGYSFISNLSSNEKLNISSSIVQQATGAATAPRRSENVGKWVNTSDSIDEITLLASNFGSGSENVVLGWDPADTHTNNFWEELASVEYSGGTALDSGTFTAKKYLWIQAYLKVATGTVDSNLWRFNADTGNNYSVRYSRDGATDATNTSASHLNINHGTGTRNNQFVNIFVINISANEKLVISHGISQGASGAATASNRIEQVGKWANTSSQITSVQCTQGNALNFESGTILKVWGAD